MTGRSAGRTPLRLVAIGTAGVAAGLILTACASSGGSPAGAGPTSPVAKHHTAAGKQQAAATTVQVHSGPMGQYLTDQNGKTLYLFASDSSTKSTCTATCLAYWPVVKGPATAGSGVSAGKLATITTAGTKQATYAGHPLYYFAEDNKAGDTNGEGRTDFGAEWWMLAPSGKAITTSTGSSGGSSGSSSAGGGGGGWS